VSAQPQGFEGATAWFKILTGSWYGISRYPGSYKGYVLIIMLELDNIIQTWKGTGGGEHSHTQFTTVKRH
jgi:hypothetical protein